MKMVLWDRLGRQVSKQPYLIDTSLYDGPDDQAALGLTLLVPVGLVSEYQNANALGLTLLVLVGLAITLLVLVDLASHDQNANALGLAISYQ